MLTGRKKSIYRTGGFWKGYEQLTFTDAPKFEKMFCENLSVNIDRFRNIRKYGSKSKLQIQEIERIFAEFGVTSNIWDNENKVY